jgi:hypothetical protein
MQYQKAMIQEEKEMGLQQKERDYRKGLKPVALLFEIFHFWQINNKNHTATPSLLHTLNPGIPLPRKLEYSRKEMGNNYNTND